MYYCCPRNLRTEKNTVVCTYIYAYWQHALGIIHDLDAQRLQLLFLILNDWSRYPMWARHRRLRVSLGEQPRRQDIQYRLDSTVYYIVLTWHISNVVRYLRIWYLKFYFNIFFHSKTKAPSIYLYSVEVDAGAVTGFYF